MFSSPTALGRKPLRSPRSLGLPVDEAKAKLDELGFTVEVSYDEKQRKSATL